MNEDYETDIPINTYSCEYRAIMALYPNAEITALEHEKVFNEDYTKLKGENIIVKFKDGKPAGYSITKVFKKRDEIEKLERITSKKNMIAEHIYTYYPKEKQAQDTVWTSAYRTKLVASGLLDIEMIVVGYVNEITAGKSIAKVLKKHKGDELKMMKKLVKIATMTHWAEECVTEGLKAIEDERSPAYPMPYEIKE